MNRVAALAVAAFAFAGAVLFRRNTTGGEVVGPVPDYAPQDIGLGAWLDDAFNGDTPAAPPPAPVVRTDLNESAFLLAVRRCEGTAAEGGYGALFGWPAAGRSFDPYSVSGHPMQSFNYTDKAGKTIKTTAAGAYQITYTTWLTYGVPFRAWALINGYSVDRFTPATQDAFALFLIYRRGALEDVRAGRIDAAIAKVRAEWASLPGAGYNQPERSRDYVLAAYTGAGGSLA